MCFMKLVLSAHVTCAMFAIIHLITDKSVPQAIANVDHNFMITCLTFFQWIVRENKGQYS